LRNSMAQSVVPIFTEALIVALFAMADADVRDVRAELPPNNVPNNVIRVPPPVGPIRGEN